VPNERIAENEVKRMLCIPHSFVESAKNHGDIYRDRHLGKTGLRIIRQYDYNPNKTLVCSDSEWSK